MDIDDDYMGDDECLDCSVTISGKATLRARIDEAVNAFLAGGGKVHQLDHCATALGDGYMTKAAFDSVRARNEKATMRKNARERNVVNYIRRCLDYPTKPTLAEISHSTKVPVAALKKIIREHMAGEPGAMALLAQCPRNWRKDQAERLKNEA